jgi:outer membrane protein OmpA-like peptidoglycan-associated protein
LNVKPPEPVPFPPVLPPAPERPQQRTEAAPPAPAETAPKVVTAPPPPPAQAPQPAPAANQPQSPPQAAPAPGPKIVAAPPAPPARPPLSPAARACQDSLERITSAGHILFAIDSATLDPASFDTLDRLAVAAKACPDMRIAIQGHTDNEGSGEYNQRLSERRAQAVAAYLVKLGADKAQLEAVGFGFTRPAAPNDTPENMARNRRIEFSVRQQ